MDEVIPDVKKPNLIIALLDIALKKKLWKPHCSRTEHSSTLLVEIMHSARNPQISLLSTGR